MRIRVLPLLIGFAALTLVVRLGVLWTDLAPAALAKTMDEPAEMSQELEFPSPAAGTNEANAEAGKAEPSMDDEVPPVGTALSPTPDDPFDMSDQEIELLQQLSERRRALDSRAQEIEQRASLLAAAEERVQLKIDELAVLQTTIEDLLIQHDDQEEAQMLSLVKIYENMKPKDAARIFEELDMIVLLEVVDRMKERKVAPVLAKMNPARAKAITLELAQRRELPVAKN